MADHENPTRSSILKDAGDLSNKELKRKIELEKKKIILRDKMIQAKEDEKRRLELMKENDSEIIGPI